MKFTNRTKPNRQRLAAVAGAADVFDIIPVPVEGGGEEGTALNAETFNKGNWRDDTTVSFGCSATIEDFPDAKENVIQVAAEKDGEMWVIPPAGKGKNYKMRSLNIYSGGELIEKGYVYDSDKQPTFLTAHTSNVSMGSGATNGSGGSVSLGINAKAFGTNSIALGFNSLTSAAAFNATSIGFDSKVAAPGTVGIGYNASITGGGFNGVAIGDNVGNTNFNSVVIGAGAKNNASGTALVGFNSRSNSTAFNSIAMGTDSSVNVSGSVALGAGARTDDNSANAISLGSDAVNSLHGYNGMAMGYKAKNNASNSIAIGYLAEAASTTSDSMAVGKGAYVSGLVSTAIGTQAKAKAFNSTAIGFDASANTADTMVLGNYRITSLRCQTQTISALSDSRVKEDIQPADTATCLRDVLRLPVTRFKYKDFTGTHLDVHRTGFMADDVAEVFPKAVMINDEFFPELDSQGNEVFEDAKDDEGNVIYEVTGVDANGTPINTPKRQRKMFKIENVKTIAMDMAVPTMWAAIQELSKEVETLKSELHSMKCFIKGK